MEPRIVHVDMDAFFASVECAHNPALKGKPLIIGGGPEDVRGVVSTASYEARQYGVHSAMPLAQARKLCPNGIYMRGHYELYAEASQKIQTILMRVSPHVQMASIDEAYIDVSGSQKLFGGDDAIAAFIKDEIRAQLQISCTVAIAPNKLVAKVASEEGKPDGYVRVAAGGEAAFLAPMAIRKIPGIGPRSCALLEGLGLRTVAELARCKLSLLERVCGPQHALSLQQAAQGRGSVLVETATRPKSISRETTFSKDRWDWMEIGAVLSYLTEQCTYTLRKQHLETRRVMLKVRYCDFETKTFAQSLMDATTVDSEIQAVVRALIPKARTRRAPIRLVGVGLSQLQYNQHQLALFGREEAEKWGRVLEQVDTVRNRLGFNAVQMGKSITLRQKQERLRRR